MPRPIVLTFVTRYLPAYRAGGPIRSIANLVVHLGDEFEFRVVTMDRDFGDDRPFPGVVLGEWTDVGLAKVCYVPSARHGLSFLRELVQSTPHDVVYHNSVFDRTSAVLPLLLRRLGLGSTAPMIIAPRGELGEGALRVRRAKKIAYLWAAARSGLFSGTTWQASSVLEANEILARTGCDAGHIRVAPNLLPSPSSRVASSIARSVREPGPLRIAFVSRISPKKNLGFLISALARIAQPTSLSIVGAVDDASYWRRCEALIDRLPPHISVSWVGAVPHEQVGTILAKHDLFAFPTCNENFGHVVIEALTVGTPVLLSPHTPWKPDLGGGLATLPLQEELWVAALERWSAMSNDQLCTCRTAALEYARRYLSNQVPIAQNRSMLRGVLR